MINKPTHDKLGLEKIQGDAMFKSWSKSLQMAFDDVWVGIEVVMKRLRIEKEPISTEMSDAAVKAL